MIEWEAKFVIQNSVGEKQINLELRTVLAYVVYLSLNFLQNFWHHVRLTTFLITANFNDENISYAAWIVYIDGVLYFYTVV
jgi:hypothetical protein